MSSGKRAGRPQIGPYRVSKRLGSGTDATVRLGVHESTDHKVALKLIKKSTVAQSPKWIHRIEAEVRALSQIKPHPHVVRFVDFFETDLLYVIATEFVEGKTLADVLAEAGAGGLSEVDAFCIFYQLVLAVGHCHQCGVCHKDLKPENVLVDLDGRVVLVDFGFCGVLDLTSDGEWNLRSRCGSPTHAAPEVVRGTEAYDGPAADVWSLGILLFEMTTGRLPFYHDNTQKLFDMICSGSYVIPPNTGAELRDLFPLLLHSSFRRRLTIAELKTHIWWLDNCSRWQLHPDGVYENATATNTRPSSSSTLSSRPGSPGSTLNQFPRIHCDGEVVPNPLDSPRAVAFLVTGDFRSSTLSQQQTAQQQLQQDPLSLTIGLDVRSQLPPAGTASPTMVFLSDLSQPKRSYKPSFQRIQSCSCNNLMPSTKESLSAQSGSSSSGQTSAIFAGNLSSKLSRISKSLRRVFTACCWTRKP